MDECDIASETEQKYRARAIADAQRMQEGSEMQLVIDNKISCLDCEKPIPAARLAINPRAVRCVKCQAEAEAK